MEFIPAFARWLHLTAPRALQFFRWSAWVTWLGQHYWDPASRRHCLQSCHAVIGLEAGLGTITIMLFNVWVLIWPNQKKILGVEKTTDSQKDTASRVAFLASRTNTMLSIPMLFFMAAGAHSGVYGF